VAVEFNVVGDGLWHVVDKTCLGDESGRKQRRGEQPNNPRVDPSVGRDWDGGDKKQGPPRLRSGPPAQ
jgi:hypothetical protein